MPLFVEFSRKGYFCLFYTLQKTITTSYPFFTILPAMNQIFTSLKKFTRQLALAGLLVLAAQASRAELNYTMTASVGTWQSISTVASGGNGLGTVAPIASGNRDDGWTGVINFGFTFPFDGHLYPSFMVNTNGMVKMDLAASAGCVGGFSWYNESPAFSGAPQNQYGIDGPVCNGVLSPLWDDFMLVNSNAGGSDIYYYTSGPVGNRICTIEWNQVCWHYPSQTPAISFQIKVYEQGGVAQFIYHRIGASTTVQYTDAASYFGASIGINSYYCSSDNIFLSLSDCGSAPAVSNVTETYNIGRTEASTGVECRPAEGQTYTWSPSVTTNDLCIQAIALPFQTCAPYVFSSYTNAGATDDEFLGDPINGATHYWTTPNQDSPSLGTGGVGTTILYTDVWFSITKPAGITAFSVSTDHTSPSCNSFATAVAVYDGCGGNPIAGADNNGTINVNNCIVTLSGLTSSSFTYYIRVTGDNMTVGSFDIAVYGSGASGASCSSYTNPVLTLGYTAATAATTNGSTTIQIASPVVGRVAVGASISGVGIPTGATIVSQTSGTSGADGSYVMSAAATATGSPSVSGTGFSEANSTNCTNADVVTYYAASTFAASAIAGTTLTVGGAVTGQPLQPGMVLTGGTVVSGTTITGYLSGNGGAGTYTVSSTQNTTCTTANLNITGEDRVYKITPTITGQYNISVSQTNNFSANTLGNSDNVGWWLTNSTCPAVFTASNVIDSYTPGYTLSTGAWGTPAATAGLCYKASKASISLTAGTDYYLYIDSRSPVVNCFYNIDIRKVDAGKGNLLTNAIAHDFLSAACGSSTWTTSGTTCEKGNDITSLSYAGQYNPNYLRGEDIVYQLTNLVATNPYSFTVTGTNPTNNSDVGFYLISGSPTLINGVISGGTLVDSAFSANGNIATKTISVAAGTTYYLVIDSWAYPDCFSYTLEIACVGSICDAANMIDVPLLSSNQTFTGTLRKSGAATGTYAAPTNTPGCSGTSGQYWTPPTSLSYNRVYYLSGASFTAATTLASTTITALAPTTGSITVGMPVTGTGIAAGTTIAALGTGIGGAGTYILSSAATATGAAVTITGGVVQTAGTYYLSLLNTTTSGATANVTWGVYKSCLPSLVNCVGGLSSGTTNLACGAVALVTGTPYYVYVSYVSSLTTVQNYSLEIGPNPISGNDLPTSATNIVTFPTTLINENNLCATLLGEPGLPTDNESVQSGQKWDPLLGHTPIWYKFNAPTSAGVYFKMYADASNSSPTMSVGYSALYHLAPGATSPSAMAISTMSCTSNVITVTTASPHNLATGDSISIYGTNGFSPAPHGNFSITWVSATSFTYPFTTADLVSTTQTYAQLSNLLFDKSSVLNKCVPAAIAIGGFGTIGLESYKNLIPGQTYYLRISGLATATSCQGFFNLTIDDINNVPPEYGTDCGKPFLVCNSPETLLPSTSLSGNYCDVTSLSNPTASFTGSISGTTLTATTNCLLTLAPGMQITGALVTANTFITAVLTGTGGIGTYTVSVASTAASTTLTAAQGAYGVSTGTSLNVTATSVRLVPGMILSGTGIAANTYITALGTGTGGAGTYILSAAATNIATNPISFTANGVIDLNSYWVKFTANCSASPSAMRFTFTPTSGSTIYSWMLYDITSSPSNYCDLLPRGPGVLYASPSAGSNPSIQPMAAFVPAAGGITGAKTGGSPASSFINDLVLTGTGTKTFLLHFSLNSGSVGFPGGVLDFSGGTNITVGNPPGETTWLGTGTTGTCTGDINVTTLTTTTSVGLGVGMILSGTGIIPGTMVDGILSATTYSVTPAQVVAAGTFITATGGNSTDWNNTANWTCGLVPSCSRNAIIPAGCTIYPIINGVGTCNVKDLIINTGGMLVMSSGTLNVCGNVYQNGSLNMQPVATLNMMGSTSQTLNGSLTGANSIGNLTVSQGAASMAVTMNADVNVEGNFGVATASSPGSNFNCQANTLSVTGNFTVNANNSFITTAGLAGGRLELNGNTPTVQQTYSNADVTHSLNHAKINNSGMGVLLQSDMTLGTSGVLTMTNGKVDGFTNAKKVIVTNTATNATPVGNSTSWVYGTVRKSLSTSLNSLTGATITSGGSGYTSAPTVVVGGPGTGATATAVISGSVTSVTMGVGGVNGGGGGYSPYTPPTVSFTGGGGAGAAGTPILKGKIPAGALTLVAAGTGYGAANTITVTFTGSDGASFAATSTTGLGITVTATTIAAISVTGASTLGSTYFQYPVTVAITSGAGSGASYTLNSALTNYNCGISGVTMTSGGSGYTSAPTVTFSSSATVSSTSATTLTTGGALTLSGGVFLPATATLSGLSTTSAVGTGLTAASGTTYTITVGTNPSTIPISGTASPSPAVTLTGQTFSIRALGTANISGTVVDINITTAGSGYTSLPTLTFSGGGGAGAAATAIIDGDHNFPIGNSTTWEGAGMNVSSLAGSPTATDLEMSFSNPANACGTGFSATITDGANTYYGLVKNGSAAPLTDATYPGIWRATPVPSGGTVNGNITLKATNYLNFVSTALGVLQRDTTPSIWLATNTYNAPTDNSTTLITTKRSGISIASPGKEFGIGTGVAGAGYIWTGAVSDAWSLPGNWVQAASTCAGASVPACGDNVTIPATVTSNRWPHLVAETAAAQNLTINGKVYLDNAASILEICGNYVNNGSLIVAVSSAIIKIKGNVNQTISGLLSGANGAFGSLVIDKPMTVSRIDSIKNDIDITGDFTMSVNGSATALTVATLRSSSFSVNVGGNMNINAQHVFSPDTSASGGYLTFNGTAAQSYTNAGRVNSVVMNNSSTGLTLSNDLLMASHGTLSMINGKITTGAYKVEVLNRDVTTVSTGILTPTGTSSWVNGTLRKYLPSVSTLVTQSFSFPVGNQYAMERMDMVILTPPTSSTYYAKYIDVVFANSSNTCNGFSLTENPTIGAKEYVMPLKNGGSAAGIDAASGGFWTFTTYNNSNVIVPASGDDASIRLTAYATNFSSYSATDMTIVERLDGVSAWTLDGTTADAFTVPTTSSTLLTVSRGNNMNPLAKIAGQYGIGTKDVYPAGSVIWTGNTSTAWNVDANWRGVGCASATAPNSCATNVYIPNGPIVWPTIGTSPTVHNIDIGSSATVNFTSGVGTLNICGDLTNTGTINLGAINMVGTGGTFTANTTVSSGTLTVTSVTNGGSIGVGMSIIGAGIPFGTTISALGTGTGGTGTYIMSANATATATGITVTSPQHLCGNLTTATNGTINNLTINNSGAGVTLGNPITGSVSGTTLTVSAATFNTLRIGQAIAGTGTSPAPTITALGTGTGGTGTYTLSASATAAAGTSLIACSDVQIANTLTLTRGLVTTESANVIVGVSGTPGTIASASSASFTGSIAGNTLTVSGLTGTLASGIGITGTGVPVGCTIASQLTGTAGSTGTYSLNYGCGTVYGYIDATASTTLKVNQVTSGVLTVGQVLTNAGLTAGTTITTDNTGPSYTISAACASGLGAVFVGDINGTTLTLASAPSQGALAVGMYVSIANASGLNAYQIASGSGLVWTLSTGPATPIPTGTTLYGSVAITSSLPATAMTVVDNYKNSWINTTAPDGYLRYYVNGTTPASFTFPVGNLVAEELMRFENFSQTGITYLNAKFNTVAGGAPLYAPVTLNVTEPSVNSGLYTSASYVIPNGIAGTPSGTSVGMWTVTPNTAGTTSTYDLTLIGKSNGNWCTSNGASILKRTTGGAANSWALSGAFYIGQCSATGGDPLVTKRTGMLGFSDFLQVASDVPLPLKDFTFTAKHNTAISNILNWSINADYPCDYFVVEHSVTGELFETIGNVSNLAPANPQRAYSLIDEHPVNGFNYYRLKLMKVNGLQTYSEVRMVENQIDQNMSVALHPNPALNTISIDMLTNSNGSIRMQIMDVLGKELYGETLELKTGRHTMTKDISDFQAGVYFVKLVFIDENQKTTNSIQKFVKL